MLKKFVSFALVLTLALSALCVPVYAEGENPAVYSALDSAINFIAGGLAAVIKTPNWENAEDYVSENFYPGMSNAEFISEPGNNAAWSLGYASASLQTGNELTEDHYVGGSLSVTKKLATEVRDDQRVRTVAISDGRGITIFATLDAYGLANTDVRRIRARFQEYADAHNLDINAVNVSVLHQHSCVDTFGMNGNIISALFTACIKNILGKELESGQNKEFMEHLFTVTVDSMKNAVESMQSGSLYFGTVDASRYIHDKRDPQVFDGNLNRLRFVPNAENGKETWLVNGAIHCVGNGAAGTVVTGDYPYYMEQYIAENADANFFYIQGAELAITSEYGDSLVPDQALVDQYGDRYANLAAFGDTLGKLVCSINNDTAVAPILNIAFNEITLPVENNILVLAAKCGLLLNKVVKSGFGKYELITEIGYAEFGKDLAVAIIPGELAPEIAFGGATSAADSWTGDDWSYPSFQSLAGSKKLIVFGITNDQIGYILSDNNWHSILTENEEIVSTGKNAGSNIATAYSELVNEVTATS